MEAIVALDLGMLWKLLERSHIFETKSQNSLWKLEFLLLRAEVGKRLWKSVRFNPINPKSA